MPRDDSKPVTFLLPDGRVDLITWSFVLNELDKRLSPMLGNLEAINNALTIIDKKLDVWVNTDEEE